MDKEPIDLRNFLKDPVFKTEEIQKRREHFASLGFSDKWIDNLTRSRPALYSPEVVNDHLSILSEFGFANPKKMIESLPAIFCYSFDNIDGKISGLKERGFTNPKKMIEGFPAIWCLSFENIEAKITGLKERGFTNSKKMIEGFPTILGFDFENIDKKITGLKERGFTNPKKMIESLPSVLGCNFENIDAKISGLKERGFANPKKIIEKMPAILGYSFGNIDAKIAGLEERGFTNPKKMIESLPSVLGYSFENIDHRLDLFGKLIRLYELPFSPTQLMENVTNLFGTKIDKIVVLARILRDYQVTPSTLDEKTIFGLTVSNIENILVAMTRSESKGSIKNLLKTIWKVRKEKKTREEKREIIKEAFPDLDKIKQRYFKGYPN